MSSPNKAFIEKKIGLISTVAEVVLQDRERRDQG